MFPSGELLSQPIIIIMPKREHSCQEWTPPRAGGEGFGKMKNKNRAGRLFFRSPACTAAKKLAEKGRQIWIAAILLVIIYVCVCLCVLCACVCVYVCEYTAGGYSCIVYICRSFSCTVTRGKNKNSKKIVQVLEKNVLKRCKVCANDVQRMCKYFAKNVQKVCTNIANCADLAARTFPRGASIKF